MGTSTATCMPSWIGLERGPHGDLGLAVADVAHDQAVHRASALQVGLDLRGGAQLVGRLLVREGRLHLRLPRACRRRTRRPSACSRAEYSSSSSLARSATALRTRRPGALPLPAAQPRQLRVLAARVARDALDLLDRHPDAAALGEVQLQEVALLVAVAAGVAPHQARVARDAVVDVDDEVARLEPLQQVLGHDAPEDARPTDADGAEQLAVGDEDDACPGRRRSRR